MYVNGSGSDMDFKRQQFKLMVWL